MSVVSLSVYIATLSRDIGLGDSAELSLQAFQLGVTHPPGYPLHTFLGKLFGLLINDPALATNLLSAVCTSLSVGLLSAAVLILTRRRFAAATSALVFGFVPAVWDAAVITEVYNVNIFVISLALLLTLRWREKPTRRLLCWIGVVLGLSMGTGLANVLLLPGFAVLILQRATERVRAALMVCSAGVLAAGLMMSWSWMRCATSPPLGTAYLPDNLAGFVRYLRGAQYTTLSIQPIAFYRFRLWEHTRYWGASLLWIGLALGLVGMVWQWRRQRDIFVSLFLMFSANICYFTFYPWIDYREMVTPSYFVFAIWIACGIATFQADDFSVNSVASRAVSGNGPRNLVPEARCESPRPTSSGSRKLLYSLSLILPLAVLVGLSVSGVSATSKAHNAKPVTEAAHALFEVFPADAVVIAHWYAFTPLLFFQVTQESRPDLTLVECNTGPRYYRWGCVEDCRLFARSAATSRPIFVDEYGASLFEREEVTPLSHDTERSAILGAGWYCVRLAE